MFCKKLKKGVLRNFTKFTGIRTCARVSFLNFIKKKTLAQVFSCEFFEISKNTFWHRTPLVLNIITIYYAVTELTLFTKPYLEWVKTGRNDSKFAIGMYHINTMKINKLFSVNVFIPVSNFPWLIILWFYSRKLFWIFGQFKGSSKETNGKNWGFYFKKKGDRKNTNN